MKKITTLLLLIAMLVPSLIACSSGDGGSAADTTASGVEDTTAVTTEAVDPNSVLEIPDGTNYNGYEFTWYSEKVLPGDGLKELNANGRTVDSDGYVVDADGFIAIASPWGKDEIGTVVETPFGLGRVYDECEDDSYDVYTSW